MGQRTLPKSSTPCRIRPLVAVVAGGSVSAKTTVVQRIVESIGEDQVSVVGHDRYYRDRSDLRFGERAVLNHHQDGAPTASFRSGGTTLSAIDMLMKLIRSLAAR